MSYNNFPRFLVIMKNTFLKCKTFATWPLGIRRTDHTTPLYPQKLALNFVDKWWSSVGIVHLRAKGHGVCFLCFFFAIF
jgi:hypothetical protein